MATRIPYPPGKTRCDWCHKTTGWKDINLTHDNEALCPRCWPAWLDIIGEDTGRYQATGRQDGPERPA